MLQQALRWEPSRASKRRYSQGSSETTQFAFHQGVRQEEMRLYEVLCLYRFRKSTTGGHGHGHAERIAVPWIHTRSRAKTKIGEVDQRKFRRNVPN